MKSIREFLWVDTFLYPQLKGLELIEPRKRRLIVSDQKLVHSVLLWRFRLVLGIGPCKTNQHRSNELALLKNMY